MNTCTNPGCWRRCAGQRCDVHAELTSRAVDRGIGLLVLIAVALTLVLVGLAAGGVLDGGGPR